jgi:hypothetical protein
MGKGGANSWSLKHIGMNKRPVLDGAFALANGETNMRKAAMLRRNAEPSPAARCR